MDCVLLLATLKTKGEMERSRQTEAKRESDGARERCCQSRREREREREVCVWIINCFLMRGSVLRRKVATCINQQKKKTEREHTCSSALSPWEGRKEHQQTGCFLTVCVCLCMVCVYVCVSVGVLKYSASSCCLNVLVSFRRWTHVISQCFAEAQHCVCGAGRCVWVCVLQCRASSVSARR